MKLVVLLATLIFMPAMASASTVIIGDCNQINKEIKVEQGGTVNIINDCVPLKPEDSFTVSFYWLDSISLSLLMAGHTDQYMKAILNESPIVVKNPVYLEIHNILSRFGERPAETDDTDEETSAPDAAAEEASEPDLAAPGFDRFPLYSSRLIGRDEVQDEQPKYFSEIPEAVRQRLKVYDGNARIIWPDLPAFDSYYYSDAWPQGYNLSYLFVGPEGASTSMIDLAEAAKSRPNATARFVLECTSMYKFIERPEFNAYWKNIAAFLDRVSDDTKSLYIFEPSSDTSFTEPGTRSNQNSYEAIKYFAKENWPSDFLLATGDLMIDQCGGSAGLELSAIPRDLFGLVAVIKPKAKTLRVKGLRYREDPQRALRERPNPTDDLFLDAELPVIDRNQSFVVPLRIELRYDIQRFTGITEDADPEGLYDKIKSIESDEIALNPKLFFKDDLISGPGSDDNSGDAFAVELPPIRKKIASFSAPTTSAITQTYIFGSALELAGVELPDGVMNVRRTPAYALLLEGGFDGASCPFFYVRERDGGLSAKGRILVGASDHSKSRAEQVSISAGTLSIVIAEKEPEITFLSGIEYKKSTSAPWVSLSGSLEIQPGQNREFVLPELAEDGASVRVSGFYRTLRSLVAAR